ncbi:MAG: ribosomal protein S18-alanine N-acetyltransferase [Clostridia bacterium]|nr:ribosomal protein S18-alanine N-acetyltransferase [Clostridia bacterium]MBR0444691.1 ribosomal protein S18-alanine N-acetyltransferase [Clostridia bacterium]
MPSVREMKLQDIPAVYKIECECFRSPWSKFSLLKELTNDIAYYYVVVEDDAVVAYTGMWVLFDEAHVTNIAVTGQYRGRGFAKLLMIRMMQKAIELGADKMTLEVRETNLPAQNLYAGFGFYQNGFRPRYYDDTGEGALILWNDAIADTLEKLGENAEIGEETES